MRNSTKSDNNSSTTIDLDRQRRQRTNHNLKIPSKKESILILHHNIQHLTSRVDQLQIVLEEVRPDILALTEHKMSETDLVYLKIENYTIRSHFSRSIVVGGGVMILAQTNIKSNVVLIPEVQDLITEREFECCVTEFIVGDYLFVLACLYRSPIHRYTSPFLNKLEILSEILCNKYSNVILTGDLNINVLKKDGVYHRFCNILKMFNMTYKIDFPTRVTSTSQSSIDNFITNINNNRINVGGIVTKIADHDAQYLQILNIYSTHRYNIKKSVRRFDRCNLDLFIKYLKRENWIEVYQATVENKYEVFHKIFYYYFDLSFPKVSVTVKPYKTQKWITNELLALQKEIMELETIFRSSKSIKIKTKLNNKREDLKKHIFKTQKIQINNTILKSSNKVKATWDTIKAKIGKHSDFSKTNTTLEIKGKVISDPTEVTNHFNNFFINMVDELIIPHIPLQPHASTTDNSSNSSMPSISFSFSEVTEKEVEKAVLSFENKLSAGIDEIPISIVKQSITFIKKPLTHLINSSLISGYFPPKLKISKVVPVFKKGNNKDVTCYRPVSILPSLSKVYERIVYNQLIKFLESNHLIDREQHGFLPGKSTITAGIELVESIINSVDAGEKVIGIFLDLSRAFDSVTHKILINKLKTLGIHNKELAWFTSFLNCRKQYVEIQSVETINCNRYIRRVASKQETIKYGIPQGSILGPLLFICYLKGMPSGSSTGRMCLYADDTNMIIAGKTQLEVEMSAYLELTEIKEFLNDHNLLINLSKSNFITFNTKQCRQNLEPSIIIENEYLNQLESTKFLGLTVDKNLSWNEHIKKVVNRMSSGIYALWRMSRLCDLDALKQIYFALVHSHLSYGISIYGAASKLHLDKILRKQKKAIRIMLHIKNNQISVKSLFKELKIPTIYSLYIIEVIKYAKTKSILSLQPTHKYDTRNKTITERHKLKFFEMKTNYMGEKCYNWLPKNIKNEIKNNKFELILKEYLTNKALYSIDEFFEATTQ